MCMLAALTCTGRGGEQRLHAHVCAGVPVRVHGGGRASHRDHDVFWEDNLASEEWTTH